MNLLPPNLVRSALSSHSWLGLMIGGLMYIVCLSGTLSIFYEEIERWEQPVAEEFLNVDPLFAETVFNAYIASPDTEITEHMYLVFPHPTLPRLKVSSDTEGRYLNEDGSPGKLGILDYGAVARLESKGLPEAMGRLIRIAAIEDRASLEQGLRDEGFIKDRTRVDPDLLLDYLSPFVEPTKVERFRFSRAWMRTQFNRINNPREPAYTVAMKLNLPPSYLLIHRTWLGGVAVLSQLEAEAPFRAILTEYLPGFAAP